MGNTRSTNAEKEKPPSLAATNPLVPSRGLDEPEQPEPPVTPRGTPGPTPLAPPLPEPVRSGSSSQGPAVGILGVGDWCCGGENRGSKDLRRKRRAANCGQSTLADCESGRAQEERRRQELNHALVLASTTGDVQRMRSVLDLGADINCTKGDKTSLHLAAHSGQVEAVQQLVLLKADTNFQDQDLRSPLHVACLNGSSSMCQVLIEQGSAKPNLQDKSHMLPLHFACVGGHYEIVEVLLKAGATVEVPEPKVQPLHFASLGGHCRIAALLLDFGADVDRQTKRDLESPLHLAASRGRNGTVALLLWRKAGVDVRNVHKCTPMHLAARRNHLDTVRLLLNARADPFATQRNDWTPMLIAFKEGNLELGRFLQKLVLDRNNAAAKENGSHPDEKMSHVQPSSTSYENGATPDKANAAVSG